MPRDSRCRFASAEARAQNAQLVTLRQREERELAEAQLLGSLNGRRGEVTVVLYPSSKRGLSIFVKRINTGLFEGDLP